MTARHSLGREETRKIYMYIFHIAEEKKYPPERKTCARLNRSGSARIDYMFLGRPRLRIKGGSNKGDEGKKKEKDRTTGTGGRTAGRTAE